MIYLVPSRLHDFDLFWGECGHGYRLHSMRWSQSTSGKNERKKKIQYTGFFIMQIIRMVWELIVHLKISQVQQVEGRRRRRGEEMKKFPNWCLICHSHIQKFRKKRHFYFFFFMMGIPPSPWKYLVETISTQNIFNFNTIF